MHVHLPKPLHGWREFVGEVGIIVIGVLIALGAEQVVENVRMRSETDELRASMRDELANDRARWEIIHAEYPCALQTLNALDDWAQSAPAGARITGMHGPSLWNTHVSSWEIARSSPAAGHIALRERDTLADLYQALDRQQRTIAIAQDDWRHVQSLAETANQPESRRALPLAEAEARNSLGQIENNFGYLEERFDRLGIRADDRGLRLGGSPIHCGEIRR